MSLIRKINSWLRPSTSPKVVVSLLLLILFWRIAPSAIVIPSMMMRLEKWVPDDSTNCVSKAIIVSNGDELYVDGKTISVPAQPQFTPTFELFILWNYGLRTDVVIPTNYWCEFETSHNLLTWTRTKVNVRGYGTNHTFYAPYEGQVFTFFRTKFTPI